MSEPTEILLQVQHDDDYAVFLHEVVPENPDIRPSFRVRVVSMASNDVILQRFPADESWGMVLFNEQVDHFLGSPGTSATSDESSRPMDASGYTSNPLFGRF